MKNFSIKLNVSDSVKRKYKPLIDLKGTLEGTATLEEIENAEAEAAAERFEKSRRKRK